MIVDSSKAIVVYDSVSLATPSFAFHAWTSMGLPKAGSKVPLTDSLWESVRATYQKREALPSCFGSGKKVIRVPYDSISNQFKDRANGWDKFRQVFPEARGFFVVGRPYFLNEAHTEALTYVAHAVDWLGGDGKLIYLRLVNGVWEVVASHGMWVS